MSPTLLEITMALILIVLMARIGVAIAPGVVDWFRSFGSSVAESAEQEENNDESQHPSK